MPGRVLMGKVVSKTPRTIKVEVERKYKHFLYKKIIKSTKKYIAHDPQDLCQNGDVVRIIESKPISKMKCWILLQD